MHFQITWDTENQTFLSRGCRVITQVLSWRRGKRGPALPEGVSPARTPAS